MTSRLECHVSLLEIFLGEQHLNERDDQFLLLSGTGRR